MCYKNGKDILPPDLLRELQKYIEGELIYIPKAEKQRAAWGTVNGTRTAIQQRNKEIYTLYCNGNTIRELVNQFCLSEESIRKIVLKIRQEQSSA